MISASIVLYNSNTQYLQKTIDSFLKIPYKKRLFLIDNSSKNIVSSKFQDDQIEYVFVGKNIGFGKAHNLVLNQLNSKYHLVLNPDVAFSSTIFQELIDQLETKKKVAFITPKVIYPDYSSQFVCRKHPTFLDLLNRKLKLSRDLIVKNSYQNIDLEKSFYPEFIHGCFMLFKTNIFKDLNGFDERYFLYMEDADICRRIEKMGHNILYYPRLKIIHHHQRGSSKSVKLFFYHFYSAIKYFLKWGF